MLKNKTILSALVIGTVIFGLYGASPAVAEETELRKKPGHHAMGKKGHFKEKMKNASPEERKAFKAKRKAKMKDKWDNMSEDERKELRKKRRAHRQEKMKNMSAEERAAFKAKHKDKMKQRFENMSPERQEKLKEKRQNRKQKHRGGHTPSAE